MTSINSSNTDQISLLKDIQSDLPESKEKKSEKQLGLGRVYSVLPSPPARLNAMQLPKHKDWINDVIIKSTEYSKSPLFKNKKIVKMASWVKTLSPKIQADDGLTVYPCSGFDLHTAAWLFPKSEILMVDEIFKNKTKDPFNPKSISFIYYKEDSNDSSLISSQAGGATSVLISRIIGLLGGTIEGVYFFNIANDGKIQFNSGKKENSGGLIVYNDLNGREKKVWFLKQDFTQDSPNISNFYRRLSDTDKVGNIFIKAMYDNVRGCDAIQHLMDIRAKRYISDAPTSMRWGQIPSRFPHDRTLIVDAAIPSAKKLSKDVLAEDEKFCYGHTLFSASELLSAKSEKSLIAKRLEKAKKRLDKMWQSFDPEYLDLYKAFSLSNYSSSKDYQNKKPDAFKNMIQLDSTIKSWEFGPKRFEMMIESFNAPISQVSNPEYRRANPLYLKRNRSEKRLDEIWGRLGLGEEFRKKFPLPDGDSLFWDNKLSAIEIYRMLKQTSGQKDFSSTDSKESR